MQLPKLVIDPAEHDAVVFDMDGVLTDTARLHARAWKEAFDELLEARAGRRREAPRPFDLEEEYRRFVDGKPRHEGVRSFLASRGIELPEGAPDDEPGRETVHGLGRRKNERFLGLLEEEGVRRFDDAEDLARTLRARGVRTAVISASRNARHVLRRAGLDELFDACIDGRTAAEEGLAGKPDPAVFLEAARRVGAEPARTVVVEDALAGVTAGRRGGFGVVVGVARGGGAEALGSSGADVVVEDLSRVAVGEARQRSIDALPDAQGHLDAMADRAGGRAAVFFLDFDGTIAPIVDRPEDAALEAGVRDLLARLARRRGVAIVSGRDLDDLRGRVGLDEVWYAGSHGFHLAGPRGWRREHREARRFLPALDEAQRRLAGDLGAVEGVQIERKRYAVAVHHRRASESAEGAVREAVERALEACGDLRIGEGREVVELRPDVDWDKGKALGWLIEALGLDAAEAFPLYVGDDVTDEDAFRAVEERGAGVVVRGRRGRTRARYALASPAEVPVFLERLDAALAERAGARGSA